MVSDMNMGAPQTQRSDSARLREELIRQRLAGGRGTRRAGIQPVDRAGRLPLSFGQERLWFLAMLDPSSPEYQVPFVLRLRGALDQANLSAAYEQLLSRHEILRTRYQLLDVQPLQEIDAQPRQRLRVTDLSELPPAEREQRAVELARMDADTPFDLSLEHPVRSRLVRLSSEEHVLVVVFHHIACDGWSLSLFARDLWTLYAEAAAGGSAALPALPVQYADFAVWQRDQMSGDALDRHLDYWRQQLADLAPLELPTDRPRPAVRSWSGERVEFTVPAELAGRLRQLASQHDTTLFTVALTGFQVLLSRYTGQRDFTVGSAMAGRSRSEVQNLIGFFLNTVVLRARLQGDPTFAELLDSSRRTVLDALDHQDAPVQLLVDEVDPRRNLSRTPLFQVMFDMAEAPPEQLSFPGLELVPVDLVGAIAKHDLRLELAELPGGALRALLEYPSVLFDRASIEQLAGHYLRLLTEAVDDPTRRLSTMELLDPAERQRLLVEWNDTARDGTPESAAAAVARWAGTAPQATAVTCGPDRLTYAQLDARANQFAHQLRAIGVGPDSVVAVCLGRRLELLPALLGVWRAGAAYVPLDPADPRERLDYLLADSGASVVVTDRAYLERLGEQSARRQLLIDTDRAAIEVQPTTDPGVAIDPAAAAYLVYTSGSTGRPKGVVVPHQGLANYLAWAAAAYTSPEGNGAPLFSSIAFDLVVTTLYVPLLVGQPVHLLPEEARVGDLGARLVEAGDAGRFSFVKLTPGHLELLAQQLAPDEAAGLTDRLLVGGEGFAGELATSWWKLAGPAVTVVNEYGPTEITVASIAFFTDGAAYPPDAPSQLLPIGRPAPNTRAYVLDDALRPVPVGVIGEVYLGGAQLAQGYWRQAGVTAERFVPDPYGPPGARLYRTGDLGRFLPDGDLMYVGRTDSQVKVRGYRVETAEIVAALRRHPAVREAVVTLRGGEVGGRKLVAYVVLVAGHAPGPEELREFLSQGLPAYMVPAGFVELPQIPLTSNGKVDYAALPDPDRSSRQGESDQMAPRTPLEEQIGDTWRRVLELDQVSVHDDFFDIGGDSLSAVGLVGQLRDAGLDLTVQDVFEHTTIAELATLVSDRPLVAKAEPRVQPFALISAEDRERLPDGVQDAYPVSRLQAGMLYEMFAGGEVNYYHNVTTYTIPDDVPFSFPALYEAAQRLAARHEVLRTGFELSAYSEPLQLVYETAELPVGSQDLRGMTRSEQERAVRELMADERSRLFDVTKPALLRLNAHVRDDQSWLLSLTECHAILEGWSFHLLLMELLTNYRQLRDGGVAEDAEPLQVRYADFIAAEQASLASAEDRQYWQRTVTESSRFAFPALWAAAPDESRDPYRLEVLFVDLEEGLQALAKAAEVPFKSVMHAAHLKVMSMLTDQPEFFSGLVCDTRPEIAGAERLCGLFLNSVPFRFRRAHRTWRELLQEVFQQEVELWPHRRYPMAEIQRNHASGRLYDVSFNYLDFRILDDDLVDVEGSIDDSPNEFRLTVTVFRGGMLNLRPHPDTISRENGQRLAAMYRQVLTAMASMDPDADARVTFLPGDERRLLEEWNETAVKRVPSTLPELFAQRVQEAPAATAVVAADGTRLSYQQLDERANQLAHHLRGLGIGPEVLVGIFVEPSVELLVGILGTLKAGGAYVPLDPGQPTERIAYLLADTRTPVVLTQERYALELPDGHVHVVCLDQEWSEIAAGPATAPAPVGDPDQLAYVIYTSGSTGHPKGVMISHRSLLNYLRWAADHYGLDGDSGAPLLGSVAFDLAVSNYLLPLVSGRDVTLLPPAGELATLAELLGKPRDFSLLKATPAHLEVLRGQLPEGATIGSVRTFVLGGESLPAQTAADWRATAPAARIINEYGPTETVVGCSVYEVPATVDPHQPVPIGRPIANTRMYVLDRDLQPVPMGAPGELYIAGEGVARGYLHRPDLTAERFLPDPHSPTPGGRCYRSGDRARFRPDGNLDFLGRVDHQLKVNGYRVEPGEIEATLRTYPEVTEAVVIAVPDPAGDPRLVGYVAGSGGEPPTAEALRERLRESLPDYLVPATLVVLDSLPRTPAGKVDRAALPAPDGVRPEREVGYVAPRSLVERQLTEIWARVLRVEQLGVHDNLFDLGADSLNGLRVAAQARQLGHAMSPMDAVGHPTVAELARHLLGGEGDELVAEVRRDAQLDPAIQPTGVVSAGSVLLTGATGFVGAALLHQLLADPDRRVLCLVRAENDEAARQRLHEAMAGWQLPVPMERCEAIAGDLSQPGLGLTPERFHSLANTVSVIYHCGALVNAAYPYRAMRAANVTGTGELIRLAATGTLSHLHHVSTLSVFGAAELAGDTLDEDSVPAEVPDSNGYAQSKWAAEELVRQAGERGVPVTIYRMGRVSWHTQVGSYHSADTFSLVLAASLELGCAPDLDYAMTLTPVDQIAAAITGLANRSDAAGRTFHIVNPHRTSWRQLLQWVRQAGHAVELVDFPQWRSQVLARSQQPGGHHFKPLALVLPEEGEQFNSEDGLPADYVPARPTCWEQTGPGCPPIDEQLVDRLLARISVDRSGPR